MIRRCHEQDGPDRVMEQRSERKLFRTEHLDQAQLRRDFRITHACLLRAQPVEGRQHSEGQCNEYKRLAGLRPAAKRQQSRHAFC